MALPRRQETPAAAGGGAGSRSPRPSPAPPAPAAPPGPAHAPGSIGPGGSALPKRCGRCGTPGGNGPAGPRSPARPLSPAAGRTAVPGDSGDTVYTRPPLPPACPRAATSELPGLQGAGFPQGHLQPRPAHGRGSSRAPLAASACSSFSRPPRARAPSKAPAPWTQRDSSAATVLLPPSQHLVSTPVKRETTTDVLAKTTVCSQFNCVLFRSCLSTDLG